MGIAQDLVINDTAMKLVIIEIKLHVNQKLYDKGFLTEEMYTKAKELILKENKATAST